MSDTQQETRKRESANVDLKTVLGGALKATGAEIPDGTYPAVLVGFGEPFLLETAEKFRKAGKPTKRTVFEALFCIHDKHKAPTIMTYLLPCPENGGINKRSNLYKMLRSLTAAEKAALMDKNGDFTSGTSLESFFGAKGMLNIKQNEKEWPSVEAVAGPMDGAKYPDDADVKRAVESHSSEGIPF